MGLFGSKEAAPKADVPQNVIQGRGPVAAAGKKQPLKYVVAVDGSSEGTRAFQWTMDHTTPADQVHLLNVHEYQIPAFVHRDEAGAEEEVKQTNAEIARRSAAILETYLAKCRESNRQCQAQSLRVVNGSQVASTITHYAESKNADNLIMGSRGLSGIRRAVLGSVSDAVVQTSKTSVTVVRTPLHE